MKTIFNGKVWLAMLVIAGVLLCGSILAILIMRPAIPNSNGASAVAPMTIIPAATSTPRDIPATLTSLPPTPAASPTLTAGEIGIGAYVQIAADALHLRSEPGLNATPLFLAFDAEVFLVTGGPEELDGYTWWHLTASYDATRSGWAAQKFLTAIPPP